MRIEFVPSVDFHVHYSGKTAQGTEEEIAEATVVTVKKIITDAANKGLCAIALVGRAEIIDNFEQFRAIAEARRIELIPGVEYTVSVHTPNSDKPFHVDLINLGFIPEHPSVRQYFGKEEMLAQNSDIARKQKDFLQSQGMQFEGISDQDDELMERLLAGKITEKAIKFCQVSVRNDRNSELVELLKRKYVADWQKVIELYSGKKGYETLEELDAKFLWWIYFRIGQPGHIPVQSDSKKIVSAIHEAKGISLYSPEGEYNQSVWNTLQDQEIDGLMAWHGKRLEIPRNVIWAARKSGLLILGGSDYNPEKNDWQIGEGDGSMFISSKRLDEYKAYMSRKYDKVEY